MTLAVMGCVVNGPGESKAASIGISLPGTGEAPNCPVFIDGQHFTTLRGTYEELAVAFRELVDDYVETRYPRKSALKVSRSGYDLSASFGQLCALLGQSVAVERRRPHRLDARQGG